MSYQSCYAYRSPRVADYRDSAPPKTEEKLQMQ